MRNNIKNTRKTIIQTKDFFLQVNINGDISFDQSYGSFTPMPFPLSDQIPIVAAYLTDIHTGSSRSSVAEIYYREDTSTEILQVHNLALWHSDTTVDNVVNDNDNDNE